MMKSLNGWKFNEMEGKSAATEKTKFLSLLKIKPFGAVWDYYCLLNDVPAGESYITDVQQYEKEVLSKR